MTEPLALARCSTDPACFRRWADGGPDRPCGGHEDDDHFSVAALREASRMIMTAPGGDGGDSDGSPGAA